MPVKVMRQEIFEECAEKLLDMLRTYHEDPGPIIMLKKEIYSDIMICRRPESLSKDMYDFYFESKEKEYQQLLASLKFTKPVKFGEDPQAWFGFAYDTGKKTRRSRDMHEKYKILYKEYFTFVPKARKYEEVWSEITAFIETLPKIHDALYDLNQKIDDYIQFKVPSGLYLFIRHPDSLVIHYLNKDIGPIIRRTVEKIYAVAGIQLAREFRAESGFDFYLKTPAGDDLGKSHSELVARVVAEHIWKHREGLIQLSVENFAKFLKQSIEAVSKWNVNQVADSLEYERLQRDI